MLIFGYDKFEGETPLNNGYEFKNKISPPNLGFAGFDTPPHDDELVRDLCMKCERREPVEEFRECHRHHFETLNNYFNISVQKVSEIKEEDKYYYVIDVFTHDFWKSSESKFINISDEVISDINSGKAKILVLFSNEALKFSENNEDVIFDWVVRNDLPHNSIVVSSGSYNYDRLNNKFISYIPFSWWEHFMLPFYSAPKIKLFNDTIVEKKKRNKVFLSYNRRARYARCKLVYELHNRNLNDYGYISLGETPVYDSEIPRSFYDMLPIKIDDRDLNLNQAEDITVKDFLDTYVSVVSETFVRTGELFPSEKIFKPIIALQPFIVYSCPGYLKMLKDFGYKTFSKWFDESYDDIDDYNKRLNKILYLIETLTRKSEEELQDMLVDMLPTLHHNVNVFLKRTSEKTFQNKLEEELWK